MSSMFYPKTLQDLPIWILWKIEKNEKDKDTKVLYSANYNGRASSTDPRTWSDFRKVWNKLQNHLDEYAGIGIVVSKEYRLIFIDIDHCVESGELSDTAADIIDHCKDQYIEVSQSGAGIHIIALGEIPKSYKNSQNGVEMYSEKRFCAMTGNALQASEPHEDQAAIDYIYNTYKKPERAYFELQKASSKHMLKDDSEVLKRAMKHEKFSLLYRGQWELAGYPSQSEADLALCAMLAFWTDRDPDMMDRLFRSSGLYREKWERADIRRNTIERAREFIQESYSRYIERNEQEKERQMKSAYFERW